MAGESERITEYLSGGGLFNPEMANHDAVRDLLIDCRAAITQRDATILQMHKDSLAAVRAVAAERDALADEGGKP